MLKRTNLIPLLVVVLSVSGIEAGAQVARQNMVGEFQPRAASVAPAPSDREQDGLVGPVRRVRTEMTKLLVKEGKPVEGPRTLLESTTYDIKGAKIDIAYYPSAGGALTGKEVYKYDEKGNISEMTLYNTDGSVLSKEIYTYEFDAVGNWTKMTTSVAVVEGGKVAFEPTEVTYRSISYFLEQNIAKLVQPAPASQPAATAQPAAVTASPNANKAPLSASTSGVNASAKPATTPKQGVAPPAAAQPQRASMLANAPANMQASVAGNAPAVKVDDEAPAQPTFKAPVKPISGGILNGKALSMPMPLYPEFAKRSRLMGMVSVEVIIDTTGKVISAKAVSGPALLRPEAEKAAMLARFSPTLLSGQPVKVAGTINYNFTLAGQ